MDTMTGKIYRLETDDEFSSHMVRVREELMTAKQKDEMQVSKFDNRTELGKLFKRHRDGNRSERRSKQKNTNPIMNGFRDKTVRRNDE